MDKKALLRQAVEALKADKERQEAENQAVDLEKEMGEAVSSYLDKEFNLHEEMKKDLTEAISPIKIETRQLSGAADSVFVIGPIAQGDEASAVRVVVAGNSASSVVVNSGTITTVTSITNSVAAAIVDSGGAQYSTSNPVPTKEVRAATGTNTSVADNAASVTILASNTARLGATVFNDSTATLLLLLGATTASSTNYTVRISSMGYYEVPFGYTGQLTGIWATDPGDGAARVTEIT